MLLVPIDHSALCTPKSSIMLRPKLIELMKHNISDWVSIRYGRGSISCEGKIIKKELFCSPCKL
uniref:Uncharacterized protein n=1 Tax=Anguilla anguilla TaxID=7936 RepID=A0A0E9QQL0_ANGAN